MNVWVFAAVALLFLIGCTVMVVFLFQCDLEEDETRRESLYESVYHESIARGMSTAEARQVAFRAAYDND